MKSHTIELIFSEITSDENWQWRCSPPNAYLFGWKAKLIYWLARHL